MSWHGQMKLRLILVLLALLAFGIPLLVWPQLDSKFRKGGCLGDAQGGLQNHGDEGNWHSPKRTFLENTFYQRTFREFHHASTIADVCFHPFARTFSEPTPEDFRDDNASEAANATTDAPLEALALDPEPTTPKKQMRGPSVPNRHGVEHQIKLFGHIKGLSD